jgi:hypothetical protein
VVRRVGGACGCCHVSAVSRLLLYVDRDVVVMAEGCLVARVAEAVLVAACLPQVFLSHRPLSFATSLLLACALCIHSILEGLALGAQQSMQVGVLVCFCLHRARSVWVMVGWHQQGSVAGCHKVLLRVPQQDSCINRVASTALIRSWHWKYSTAGRYA